MISSVYNSKITIVMEGISMWTNSKSLLLSKTCTILFMVLLLVCLIIAPWLVSLFLKTSYSANDVGSIPFFITIYVGGIPATALLVLLYRLLQRIGSGRVFVKENAACLRYISWCCFIGAMISLVSMLYYIPWIALGIAAAFMGLVIRVIKNVFAEAIALQEDTDLTI